MIEIVKAQSKDAVATIQDFITNQKHGIAYCVHDEKSVFMSDPSSINAEACAEHGYTVLDTQHNGGVVVVSAGDVSVIHFGEIENDWMRRFAKYLIKRYREKGLNAEFKGNDVLIDGYKISGLSAKQYGEVQYSTIHFGINTNLEHIKEICKKPMKKIPKGLSEYGITTEEVEQMFLDYIEQENRVVEKERHIPAWKALEIILGGEV